MTSLSSSFSPREIVSELDRYIIGQNEAKRAVAIALRNRWRRQQLTGQMREEVMPKNILMIGLTAVCSDFARRWRGHYFVWHDMAHHAALPHFEYATALYFEQAAGSSMSYTFRSVEKSDLPMLKRWIAEPHWQQWWGNTEEALAEIEAAMDEDATEPMIAELSGKSIAYVQTYDPHLEDDHPYQDQPFGTLGLDISIGETADLGKGHGRKIIAALAALLFNEGVPRLIIDPDPSNARAIKAYEKAGFVAFDTRTRVRTH